MEIKRMTALPIIAAKMVIGAIEIDHGSSIRITDSNSKFFFTVARKVANQLKAGEEIIIIYVPHRSLEFDKYVLYIGKKGGFKTEALLGKGTAFEEMYHEFAIDGW